MDLQVTQTPSTTPMSEFYTLDPRVTAIFRHYILNPEPLIRSDFINTYTWGDRGPRHRNKALCYREHCGSLRSHIGPAVARTWHHLEQESIENGVQRVFRPLEVESILPPLPNRVNPMRSPNSMRSRQNAITTQIKTVHIHCKDSGKHRMQSGIVFGEGPGAVRVNINRGLPDEVLLAKPARPWVNGGLLAQLISAQLLTEYLGLDEPIIPVNGLTVDMFKWFSDRDILVYQQTDKDCTQGDVEYHGFLE